MITWLRGSLLTAYRARLDPETFEAFVARLRERLAEVLPPSTPGNDAPFVFTYKRTLVWGRKGSG